ncbi:MAG: molybdenum cofactor biosynthesis protein A [Methanosaeta sp. PtaU1.Bin112]|nr:MAG: molybdenum cofactor biosynthesis protein A [Methanosaeta sp. PtaU1.Bin112]
MKGSLFNVFIALCDGKYAIFNTMTGALVFADEDLKGILGSKDVRIDELDSEMVNRLEKMGLIVENGVDERRLFKYNYLQNRYSNRDAHFSILLTYKCNLSCPYCYEGRTTKPEKSMDDEMVERVIKAIIGKVKETGSRNLSLALYGGEPLLCLNGGMKILRSLSSWCNSENVNFKSALISNGTLLTRATVNTISGHVDAVQLTLDGPRWYHDRLRVFCNGRGTYDRILESIPLLREAGISVILRVQVSMENIVLLAELFDDLKKKGFSEDKGIRLYAFPLMELNPACCSYSSLCIDEDSYEDILPTIWAEGLKKGFVMAFKPTPSFIQPYCSFASDSSYLIDAFGDVYKCVSLVGQQDHKVARIDSMGRFIDVSFELCEFMARDPLKLESCFNCVYLPTCSGGCAYRSLLSNRTYFGKDCALHRTLEYKKILFYIRSKYSDRLKVIE